MQPHIRCHQDRPVHLNDLVHDHDVYCPPARTSLKTPSEAIRFVEGGVSKNVLSG